MTTALVTGGAGFIGSHLAKRLICEGWDVHIVDNLSTGFKSNIPSQAQFTFLDLSHDEFPKKLPAACFDVVFHLAAQSSGEISFDDPVYDLKTNCQSTLLLLNWCRQQGIPRFIYTSSMSIYGDQLIQPVREDAKPMPKSFYGIGKWASESYLNIYSQLGLQTTSLRLFNVYGQGQNMKNMRQGMVSIYLAYILKKQEILVKGSPDRYRDFVYVDDVIDAFMRCVGHSASFGKTYNVASGRKTSVRELLEVMLQTIGYDPLSYPIQFGRSTPGDTFGIYADISSFRDDIGWEPKTSISEGLKAMLAWATSNKHPRQE